MLKTSSRARKQNLGLTVTQATSQARRHVDKIMPGVGATVESRGSYDFGVNADVIITHITFPALRPNDSRLWQMYAELSKLPGIVESRGRTEDSSVTITRKR